ncbi:MAG: MFS transporter [Rubrivivax sp.]|nr:MFS transporter [Rubrivivax sp.]
MNPERAPRDPQDPRDYQQLVSALSLGQILCWAALYYGFSSFVLPMLSELGWSKATVMGANTLGLLVWGLATYGAGAAVDRGHARALMSAGCACGAAGFGWWAVAQQPWELYGAWVLLGLACAATLYEPAFNVLTRRFPERYRQGITALTLVAGFASTLSFPAVALLIQAFGWRGALACLAALMSLLLVPLHLWSLKGAGGVVMAAGASHGRERTATLGEALRMPVFWLLSLCFTGYSLVMAAFWAHAMPLLASKGLSEAQALAVLVWVGPAQVAGRWVFARWGGGLSLWGLGVVVLLGVPLSMALLAVSQQAWALILSGCVYGVCNGLVTIVRGALMPEYFGRAHIGRIGGAMSAIGLVSRAIGPLAVAWWLLWRPGYDGALWALAALGAVSALAFVGAGRPAR